MLHLYISVLSFILLIVCISVVGTAIRWQINVFIFAFMDRLGNRCIGPRNTHTHTHSHISEGVTSQHSATEQHLVTNNVFSGGINTLNFYPRNIGCRVLGTVDWALTTGVCRTGVRFCGVVLHACIVSQLHIIQCTDQKLCQHH